MTHVSKTVDIEVCEYYKMNIKTVVKGATIGKAIIYNVKKIKPKEFRLFC